MPFLSTTSNCRTTSKIKVVKDTLYADYLYCKGVVKSSSGDYDSTLLKEALDIWESGTKKNYLKIMKINYFLGVNYFLIGNQSTGTLTLAVTSNIYCTTFKQQRSALFRE
jgi:hypothetical protein